MNVSAVTIQCWIMLVLLAFPALAQRAKAPAMEHRLAVTERRLAESSTRSVKTVVVWRENPNLADLNVLEGPGGLNHSPGTDFQFIKESEGGTSPKFVVKDENGVRWKVKLGPEAKPETAASRLMWAAGYSSDDDYYRSEIRVAGMKKILHGAPYTSEGGVVHEARLERIDEQTKPRHWNWQKAPEGQTREFNGLRVMMALLNNWDLKTENNSIHDHAVKGQFYVVSDLGASFGRTGDSFLRSKGVLQDYAQAKFIRLVKGDQVDFVMHSRPFFLSVIFRPDYYIRRTRIERITKHIPLADARWLGHQLGRLSERQIGDCFRAAGYSASEVEGYTRVVFQRIEALKAL